MNNTLNRLQDIFRDVFDEDEMVITPTTTNEDIEDWDSMAQLNLVVNIEKEFKVKFKVEEIAKIRKVNDFIVLIEAR